MSGRVRIATLIVMALLAGCGPAASPDAAPSAGRASPQAPGSTPGTVTNPPVAGSTLPASASCTSLAMRGPSPAPGATISPWSLQSTYAAVAQAFNDTARSGLGRLADPAASLDARHAALVDLAAAERCFQERLAAIGLPAAQGDPEAELRVASQAVATELDRLARATAAELDAGQAALRQRYQAAGAAAARLRAAITRTYFTGWERDPPSIAVGPPIASPGELWARSAGWGITNGSGSASLGVANPWDAIALDVTLHVWFIAEDGSDYMPPTAMTVGSVGPGETTVVDVALRGNPRLLLHEILADVPGARAWYSLAGEPIPGR